MEGKHLDRKMIRHTLQGTSIGLSLWLQFIMKENMLAWSHEVANNNRNVLTQENRAMCQKAKEWIVEAKSNEKPADNQRAQDSSSQMQASDSNQNRKWNNRDPSITPWPKKYWDKSDCCLNLGVNSHQLTATGKISGRHSQLTPCVAIVSANAWVDLGCQWGCLGLSTLEFRIVYTTGKFQSQFEFTPSPHDSSSLIEERQHKMERIR